MLLDWVENSFSGLYSRPRLAQIRSALLRLAHSLRKQFHVNAVVDAITIGNSMIYAAIHQFGGQAGRGRTAIIAAPPLADPTEWRAVSR